MNVKRPPLRFIKKFEKYLKHFLITLSTAYFSINSNFSEVLLTTAGIPLTCREWESPPNPYLVVFADDSDK